MFGFGKSFDKESLLLLLKTLSGALLLSLAGGISFLACNKQPPYPAATDPIVLRLAFNQPAQHPEYKALEQLATEINRRSNGRYELQLFPDELLGPQLDTLEQVSEGNLDFCIVGAQLLSNYDPAIEVLTMPFLFKDGADLEQVLLHPDFRDLISRRLSPANLLLLSGFYGGTRNIYTTYGPVHHPDDLIGRTIRVPQTEFNRQMIALHGAKAAQLDQGEIYTALKTNQIDGSEHSALTYLLLRHYEGAPYYNLTRHLVQPDLLIVNKDRFERLPEFLQREILNVLPDLAREERSLYEQQERLGLARIAEQSYLIEDVDREAFMHQVRPYYRSTLREPQIRAIYDTINHIRASAYALDQKDAHVTEGSKAQREDLPEDAGVQEEAGLQCSDPQKTAP